MNDMTQPAATTIVVAAPPPELAQNAGNMLAVANGYVGEVTFPEMRTALATDLQRCKAMQELVETERTKITDPLHKAWKNANAFFKRLSTPLEQAESIMKREALRFDGEQERIRRNAIAEATRKADEERRRLQAEAAKQTAAGNTETAHAITQAAQMVAPIPVATPAPKIAGESHREQWSAAVDDIVALARAVGGIPREPTAEMLKAAGQFQRDTQAYEFATVWRAMYDAAIAERSAVAPDNLLPNMPVLNGQARALKGSFAIPGVRAVCERILASRAA